MFVFIIFFLSFFLTESQNGLALLETCWSKGNQRLLQTDKRAYGL